MRRSRSALFLIALVASFSSHASAQTPHGPAQAAPPPSAPPSVPAAPSDSAAPPPTAPAVPATAPAVPTAPSAPAPASAPPSPSAPASAPATAPTAPPAADATAPAAAAESVEAPSAQPQAEAAPEPKPQPRPSFLDSHPPGYLPPLYRSDARVHRGFAVRISAGLGYGIMRRRVTDTSSYKVRGLEGQLSLDVGASVIDNLIVFGRFSGFAWNSMFVTDSRNAGGAYLGLLAAGARYYLMPENVFASAALGVAAVQVLNDLGVSQNAYPGFGMELEAGKDFWAGTPLDQRGIGLSLRFGFVHCGSVQHPGAELKPWNSYSISVLFSAAFN